MSVCVYEVRPNVGAPPITETLPSDDAPDYSKMTNPQLAALCRERGIEVGTRPKKADLIALLEGGD